MNAIKQYENRIEINHQKDKTEQTLKGKNISLQCNPAPKVFTDEKKQFFTKEFFRCRIALKSIANKKRKYETIKFFNN